MKKKACEETQYTLGEHAATLVALREDVSELKVGFNSFIKKIDLIKWLVVLNVVGGIGGAVYGPEVKDILISFFKLLV